jgi:hypothetical protein
MFIVVCIPNQISNFDFLINMIYIITQSDLYQTSSIDFLVLKIKPCFLVALI